jgi:ferredoxin
MSNSQLPRIKRVSIEEDLCCAHYLCEGGAPEIFHAIDGEWTVRLHEDIDEQKLQSNFRCVMWAAKICPVSAIRIESDDGQTLNRNSPQLDALLGS